MPKMKTKSSAKKRFTVTGTGKLKRKHAFKSHILTKKGTKQKRNLTQTGLVSKADTPNIKTQFRARFRKLLATIQSVTGRTMERP